MSALTRMANGENRWLTIGEGDTVILSSHPIPGNEMDVSKVIDGLVRLGAKVVHSGIEDVHATGHAKQEEIKTLLSIVEPQWYVPVHGEYRHLVANAELAAGHGRARGAHAGVRGRRPAHHRRRGHPRQRAGAGRLPLRRRHRRRRRPGRAARPPGARRGGRGGRRRRPSPSRTAPSSPGPRSSPAAGCTPPRPRRCSTSAPTSCARRSRTCSWRRARPTSSRSSAPSAGPPAASSTTAPSASPMIVPVVMEA